MQLPRSILQAKQQHVILAHEDTTTLMKTETHPIIGVDLQGIKFEEKHMDQK